MQALGFSHFLACLHTFTHTYMCVAYTIFTHNINLHENLSYSVKIGQLGCLKVIYTTLINVLIKLIHMNLNIHTL